VPDVTIGREARCGTGIAAGVVRRCFRGRRKGQHRVMLPFRGA